ncbi:MAG TPA: response regulator [Polyangiaceae bacterium]|nr:response regulator [Polyangiaceae bacterium]
MLNDPHQDQLHVVLIEDNDDSRMMMCELLELSGFHCHTAESGLMGLEIIEEQRPDVAIVDIGLPDIDGFEVARRLRRKHEDVHLIALTGYGQREDREEARRAGFDTHLVKPVDFEVLFTMLRAQAASRSAVLPEARDSADLLG